MITKILRVDWLLYGLARALKKLRLSAIKNSELDPKSKWGSGCQFLGVKMGRYSYCGYDCSFLNVDIGAFCSIADSVYIGGAGHPMHFVSTSPVFLAHKDSVRKKFARHVFEHLPKTIIGNDVWIGVGAKIRAGTKIGDGAVVGMGAVVTRDVQPYAIVAGNPARVIAFRFAPTVISTLLSTKWWDLDDKLLEEKAALFNSPENFLKHYAEK